MRRARRRAAAAAPAPRSRLRPPDSHPLAITTSQPAASAARASSADSTCQPHSPRRVHGATSAGPARRGRSRCRELGSRPARATRVHHRHEEVHANRRARQRVEHRAEQLETARMTRVTTAPATARAARWPRCPSAQAGRGGPLGGPSNGDEVVAHQPTGPATARHAEASADRIRHQVVFTLKPEADEADFLAAVAKLEADPGRRGVRADARGEPEERLPSTRSRWSSPTGPRTRPTTSHPEHAASSSTGGTGRSPTSWRSTRSRDEGSTTSSTGRRTSTSPQKRVEDELGLEVHPGGHHVKQGSHNRIVPLGNAYLELMAIDDREEAARRRSGRSCSSGSPARGYRLGGRGRRPPRDRAAARHAAADRQPRRASSAT